MPYDDDRGHLFAMFRKATSWGNLNIDKMKDYKNAWSVLCRLCPRSFFEQQKITNQSILIFLQQIFKSMDAKDRLILGTAFGTFLSEWPDSEPNFSDNTEKIPVHEGVVARRDTLRQRWTLLHTKMGIQITPAPSNNTLRGALEDQSIYNFVDAILGSVSLNEDVEKSYIGKALVFGAAVIDIGFHLHEDTPPAPETSTQAREIVVAPGGKGLTQAVAMSRMGFDVALVAAVGDQIFDPSMILKLLRDEGISTDMIDIITDQMTPVTGVLTFRQGNSSAIGDKRESVIRVTPEFVDECFNTIDINALDFVLITYEIPCETVSHILRRIAKDGNKNTTVIVTPAPPVRDPANLRELQRIDYLIASIWESQEFLGSSYNEKNDIPSLVEGLLSYGIRAVCIPTDGQIYLNAYDRPEINAPACFVPRHRDNTGERDACCAALAYQLKKNGVITEKEMPFITAAMAISTLSTGVSSSIPDGVPTSSERYSGITYEIPGGAKIEIADGHIAVKEPNIFTDRVVSPKVSAMINVVSLVPLLKKGVLGDKPKVTHYYWGTLETVVRDPDGWVVVLISPYGDAEFSEISELASVHSIKAHE